jgi:hypothetical protein
MSMTHLRSLAIAWMACALVAGCHDARHDAVTITSVRPSDVIFGSGVVVTESRPVSGFSVVSTSLPARLVIVQSGTESLSVTAEDNILPLVRTEVAGGRLVLSLAPAISISITREIVIEVSARTVTAIEASGATRVELTRLETDALSLQASGASQVTGSGNARALRLDLSGAVRCELGGLASRSAVTSVSGTSYARLRVAESLEAIVSGLSVIEYYGDAAVVASVSGASTVRRLGP